MTRWRGDCKRGRRNPGAKPGETRGQTERSPVLAILRKGKPGKPGGKPGDRNPGTETRGQTERFPVLAIMRNWKTFRLSPGFRSEEHKSELQSLRQLVC